MSYLLFMVGFLVLLGLFAALPFLMLIRFARKDFKGLWVRLVIWVIVSILLCVWGLPGYARLASTVNFNRCCQNQFTIAQSLGLYAAKNEGVYPDSLKYVYLGKGKEIPLCLGGRNYTYEVNDERGAFTITCRAGHRLPGMQEGCYPQYSSLKGLIKGVPDTGNQ
ncbi:MAG: hypothetical protein M1269_07300 [Chloroflexi bacterium]|nr:hypothetical protein [Chloroflexota bacterium]